MLRLILSACCIFSFSCLVPAEQAGNAIGGKNAESEARLKAVMDLMVKSANSSADGKPAASPNQSEAHKQMNAVLGQWADFIEAVKNDPLEPEMPPGAKPGRRTAVKQTRWYNNNNNYNNNYNNNNDPPAEEVHENYYYANQGYYSRKGSPGTEDKKGPKTPSGAHKPKPAAAASAALPEAQPPAPSADQQGTDGNDGKDGQDGKHGNDGKDGKDGKGDKPAGSSAEVPESQNKDDKPIF
ncbi:hypothetical protein RvY_16052 [Ramazzottius varieornatus]|uniref:Uncharacterized protein n=1 Tax=Ramazzottius varieornatus TaxID=947166 RepID=A0A1D1W4X2_RAMVA|nr:hypothetical protein RvY_16052 [Ramazzottius varieornatus]